MPPRSKIFCRVRYTGYGGRSACPHLGAWAQVWGGRRKAFTSGPVCSAPLHTTRAVTLALTMCAGLGSGLELRRRRHFREESKSGSDRNRWSFQSLPALAIPIRVAQGQKIQQNHARAQRRVCPRPPLVSFWDPTFCGPLDTAVSSGTAQTFFLFHRARRIFFLMSQKENGGCIPVVPVRYGYRTGPQDNPTSRRNNPQGR